MNRLLLGVCLMLSASAFAAEVSLPGAAAQGAAPTAWASAVGQVLNAQRSQGAALPGGLAYLATPVTGSTLMIDEHPHYADYAVAALQADGWSEERFAKAPKDQQAAALIKAEETARDNLNTQVWDIIQYQKDSPADGARRVEAGTRAARLLESAFPLIVSHDSAGALKYADDLLKPLIARGRAAENARQARIEEFSRRLPAFIAGGGLFNNRLFSREDGRWRLAYEALPAYASADDAALAEADRISKGALGPWSQFQLNVLKDEVLRQKGRGAISRPLEIDRRLASVQALIDPMRASGLDGSGSTAPTRLDALLSAERRPSARLIARAEKDYLALIDWSGNSPATRLMIMDWLDTGKLLMSQQGQWPRYPSWPRLKKAKDAVRDRLNRLAGVLPMAALVSVLGSLAAGLRLAASFPHLSLTFLSLGLISFPVALTVGSIVEARRRLLRDVTLEQRMADYESLVSGKPSPRP